MTKGAWTQTYKLIASLFLLSFCVRLGFLLWAGPIEGGDTHEYLQLAHNLYNYGEYSLSNTLPFVPSIRRAPLFPFFLTGAMWLGRGALSLFAVCLIHIALDSVITITIFLWMRQAMPLKFAVIGAVFYSLSPGAIAASTTVLSETLFTALLVVSAYQVSLGVFRNKLALTALGGGGLGLAILCRPIAFPLLFILVISIIVMKQNPRRLKHGVLILGISLLVIFPWLVRCYQVADSFVLVQGFSGIQFYVAARSDLDQLDETRLWGLLLDPKTDDPYFQRLRNARNPAEVVAADRFGVQQSIDNIMTSPQQYFLQRIKTFPHLFLNSFDIFTGINQSFSTLIATGQYGKLLIKGGLLNIFSLFPFVLGIISLTQVRGNFAVALCASVWVFTLLIHIPMWIEYRFWIPAAPFLLVSAVSGAKKYNFYLARILPCKLNKATIV